jgi:hypothetical protein
LIGGALTINPTEGAAMLVVNREKSGVVAAPGMQKLRVCVDGTTRLEAESLAAQDLAFKTAAEMGFGNSGLCEIPMVAPVDGNTNEVLDEAEVFNPNANVSCYRAEFLLAQRL